MLQRNEQSKNIVNATAARQGPRHCKSALYGGFQMFLEPRHQLDEVARPVPVVELVLDDVVPTIAAGAGRAGQGEEIGAAGDTGGGAALDRRGADLLIGEIAEKLAKPGDLLFINGMERLRRDVAAGDARSAGRNDDIDGGIADPSLELSNDCSLVVANDFFRDHPVTRSGDELGEGTA